MQFALKTLQPKKLIGQKTEMYLAENKTFFLWNKFMPRRNEIKNQINSDLFSVEIYPENYFQNFNPSTSFQKWAAVEVTHFENLPNEMNSLIIAEGEYAVFVYKGKPANAASFFESIFTKWLPENNYSIDQRPHFAIMGEKYKQDSDDSEEEIWIPIRKKL